jgi:hypothetical protein
MAKGDIEIENEEELTRGEREALEPLHLRNQVQRWR